MTKADIERTKRDFSKAAQYAKAAGFDGLELHSSGPFLFPAFLNSRLNVRKDEYGGSAENRARFLLETIDELIQVWGPGRVSVKLQPHIKLGAFAPNEDTEPTFRYVLEQLNHRKLAFLQLMGDQKLTDGDEVVRRPWIFARGIFQGTILAGGAFTKELVYRLAYNGDVAAGQLAVFQGASEAPISGFIRVERATRKNSQLAAARRVALKMGRRLRCSSVTYQFRYAPSSRLADGHFERNDVTIICETVH